MDHRQDAPHSPDSPEIGRLQLLTKTVFDGTKLPLVAPSSQNHHIWCELRRTPHTRPVPLPTREPVSLIMRARTLIDESRAAHLYSCHRVTAPESKVARPAQLCASHWVQGSPLPPAAQAIYSLIRGSTRALSITPQPFQRRRDGVVSRLAAVAIQFNSNRGVSHG
jgi:hypothetical protein